MTDRRIPLPTVVSRRTVAYLVGFGVAVPIGLAPFLGKLNVPGFVSLLTVLPDELRDVMIPVSAFLMGIVAAAIQFYFGENIAPGSLSKPFAAGIIILLVGLGVFVKLRSDYVVSLEGRRELVVVGWSGAKCKTCDGLSDYECLVDFGFQVERCWSSASVRQVRHALSFSYLLLTGGFGALIGVVMIKEEMLRRQREEQKNKNDVVLPEAPPREAPRRAVEAPVPTASELEYDLFLSYASKDRDFVEGLVNDLQSRGRFTIWWDQHKLEVGDALDAVIKKGLQASRHFAVVLSPSSVISEWVLAEAEYARTLANERRKKGMASDLIPILHQECDVPLLLKRLKYADFTQSYDHGLAELLRKLRPPSSPPQSQSR